MYSFSKIPVRASWGLRRPQRLFSQSLSSRTDARSQFDTYCFESVRSADYESFLYGLMYPQKYRDVFFAIQAFNIEVATIQDQIPRNSVQAGRLRFQFWKDSLQQIYFGRGLSPSNNQPVAQALSFYIPQNNLTLRWFERSLECRYLSDSYGAEIIQHPMHMPILVYLSPTLYIMST